MDISELRKQPHLSASQINGYIECSLSYKFSKIDKIKPEYTSDALVFGSTVHHVIAQFHQERMVGNILPAEELQKIFEICWRKNAKDREDIKYKKGKDFQTLLVEGKAILSTYREKFPLNNFTVLAIEEPFVFSLDNLTVPIIGFIDLIEEDDGGNIIISDLKTTGRAYSSNEIDSNFQLSVYNLAMRENGYHDRDIILRLDLLIKTRNPRFEQAYTVRNDEDLIRVKKKAQIVWEGISKEVFVPNDTSWKCPYCEYKNYCDEWFQTP